FDEYLDVVAGAREEQRDPSELARLAVAVLDAGGGGERVEELRLVLVDDLPEATESTLGLLAALARRGIPVIAFGDPDVAANAFRGGEPDALGRLSSVLGVSGIPHLVLERAHRPNTAIREFTAAVTGRVGAAAAGALRRAVADRGPTERAPLAR